MRTGSKLKPGRKGTKKLVAQYGDQLVRVRYRYDAKQKKRFKTVELIIDEADWVYKPRPIRRSDLVAVHLQFREKDLKMKAIKSGAKWNDKLKRWIMRYDDALKLGLQDRVTRKSNL